MQRPPVKKIIFIFLLFLPLVLFFYAQERVVSPERKPLENYHRIRLDDPRKFSMRITHHSTQKERIPYLFVSLDDTRGLSDRAQKVRREVSAMEGRVDFSTRDATIVMLHGKNGRKEDLLPMAERYTALGFDCILIDIPAHGESALHRLYYGTKVHEQEYVDRVIEDAALHHSVNTGRLLLWGYSLGGAFAVRSAYTSKYDFKAMVLVATFDALDGILEDKSKSIFGDLIGVPIYRIFEKSMKVFYDLDITKASSVTLAKSIRIPVFFTHGSHDPLIAIRRGKSLFDRFASPRKYFNEDKDADHQTIFITKQQFYAQSGLFFMRVLGK